jgi:LuxR family maltose regulon positive regulatory protein
MAIQARAILATFHVLTGRLHAMADSCDAAIALADASELGTHPVVSMAHQFKGYALFEWNRLDEARTHLERAWALAPEGSVGVRSGVARVLASVAAAQDDPEAADRWLATLESVVAEPMTLRNREWLAAVRVRHGLRRSRDLRQIDGWIRRYDYGVAEAGDSTERSVAAYLHEYEHVLAVLEATSQWAPMLPIADALAEGSGRTRLWFRVRALTARAVALEALSRPDAADEAWSRALGLGDAEGYVRAFVDGAATRRRLLVRAAQRPSDRSAAERVMSAAGLSQAPDTQLTAKQRETLHHVSEGRSNRDTAAAMEVSEATVKTHLREVYRRLGVGSRTQAVAEARRLGLL